MRRRLFIVVAAVGCLWCGQVAAGELFVIVNAANPVPKLSLREVVSLFTGRTRAFPTGQLAQAFDQEARSTVRARFYLALTGMDLARINSYWSRLQFTGQVQPPRAVTDDQAMIERIRHDPNGIGYVTVRPPDADLKVVLVLQDPEPAK